MLQWNEVVNLLCKEDDIDTGISVPMGVTADDALFSVTLSHADALSHIALFGRVGSGKSTAVNFILAGLKRAYRDSLVINYIDGKDCNIYSMIRDNVNCFANAGVVAAPKSKESLTTLLSSIYVNSKRNKVPTLTVIDDAGHLFDKDLLPIFGDLVENLPEYKSHLLLCEQVPRNEEYINFMRNRQCVSLCKVSESDAMLWHGNTMAAEFESRAGHMVVKVSDVFTTVKVPYTAAVDIWRA